MRDRGADVRAASTESLGQRVTLRTALDQGGQEREQRPDRLVSDRVLRRQASERDNAVRECRVDECDLRRKVPVERTGTDPGANRDLVERDLVPVLGESRGGGSKDLGPIRRGVGADRP